MYRSQFMPQAEAIGTIKFFPPVGTTLTTSGQEWLKTGLAKDKTNYPEASQATPCQLVGNPIPTWPSPNQIYASAYNGSGKVLVVRDNVNSTLFTSSDYGATWSTVNCNNTETNSLAYNGTTWVVVGNSASSVYIRTSTDGTTWSSQITLSHSPGTATPDTASVCWDSVNSKFVLVIAGSSATEAAAYSSDGTTWTKVNLATSLSGRTSIAAYAGTILACGYGSGVVQKTTNGGNSWSTATNSGGVSQSNVVAASGKFFRLASTSSMIYTTDGTTWTTSSTVTELGFGLGSSNQTLVSDGTTVYFNANQTKFIGYTTDGVNFTYKSANWNTGYGTSIACGGTDKVFAYGIGTTHLYTANPKGCDYVGTSTPYYNLGTTYQAGYMVGYIRIK